ncbi:MAG: GAF and ANTAR domain-containing protein [Ornithinimicrobium sp.]
MTESTGGDAPDVPGDVGADEADLRASLADLAGLVSDRTDMHGLLGQVATFAVQAIPGADGAGVTLLRTGKDSRIEALAASSDLVSRIDVLQYDVLNEGPCITAVAERRTVRSGSLGTDHMWPRFGPQVSRIGVHSALSLPLLLPEQTVGAINVYALGRDVFDDHAARLGELFADPAAVAVHNAQVLTAAQRLAEQLQQALSSRPIIDQAVGILRARTGASEAEALNRLRAISQQEHTKMVDVAAHMVEAAAARARARHTQD